MKVDYIALYTAHGQKETGLANWYPWLFEAVTGGILMTGAVCPAITRGKRKGKPNVKKRDRSTECKVFYPVKN